MSELDPTPIRTGPRIVEQFGNVSLAAPIPNPNVRRFEGDGTARLHVPGCKSVKRVLVGAGELPAYIDHPILVAASPDILEPTRFPLYKLAADDLGNPILLRGLLSNNGLWQDGHAVYIEGEWETEDGYKTFPPVEGQSASRVLDQTTAIPVDKPVQGPPAPPETEKKAS